MINLRMRVAGTPTRFDGRIMSLAPTIQDMDHASGLALHGRKGFVVPLLQGASDRVHRRVALDLRRCAPEWRDSRVDERARYLRLCVGPYGGEGQRGAAVCKWRQRCKECAVGAMLVKAGAAAYRPRALPVLLYVA